MCSASEENRRQGVEGAMLMYTACTSSQPVGGLSWAQLVVALPVTNMATAAVVAVAASAVVFVAVAGYSYARVTHPFLSLFLSLTLLSHTVCFKYCVCFGWFFFFGHVVCTAAHCCLWRCSLLVVVAVAVAAAAAGAF